MHGLHLYFNIGLRWLFFFWRFVGGAGLGNPSKNQISWNKVGGIEYQKCMRVGVSYTILGCAIRAQNKAHFRCLSFVSFFVPCC